MRQWLWEVPGDIGMTKIAGPFVEQTTEGLTGIVIIAESHIAIHTFPKLGRFYLDVFSCKSFDTWRFIGLLINKVTLVDYNYQVIERGLEYVK